MTIFHALKYQVADVTDSTQLDLLPKEVIASWRKRVEDYAIKKAESVAHLDKTGSARRCLDAIHAYQRGEITCDELSAAAAAYTAYAAAYSAYYAARAVNAANAAARAAYAAATAANAAATAANAAGVGSLSNATYEASLNLFAKWLTEELMNYEVECV